MHFLNEYLEGSLNLPTKLRWCYATAAYHSQQVVMVVAAIGSYLGRNSFIVRNGFALNVPIPL